MSRSRRHSPFIGFTTADSDKLWKQQSARKVRRRVHQTLAVTIDGDTMPDRRQVAEPWVLKDGKHRIDASLSRYLRN